MSNGGVNGSGWAFIPGSHVPPSSPLTEEPTRRQDSGIHATMAHRAALPSKFPDDCVVTRKGGRGTVFW